MPFEGYQDHGSFDAEALRAARLVCHWAAQLPAAVGNSLVDKKDDWSHTALRWDEDMGTFSTLPFAAPRFFRVGLRPTDLTLLLHEDETVHAELPLVGLDFDTALERLSDLLRDTVVPRLDSLIPRKREGMPDHPVGKGAKFELADPTAHAELARGYANAWAVLVVIRSRAAKPSPVLCWPHHFDLAFLDTVIGHRDAEKAHTVGTGFLAGDDMIDEPYWYVSPWPTPEGEPDLPELPTGGEWRTDGFFGAVLPLRTLVKNGGDNQAIALAQFLASAIATGRKILMPDATTP